MQNIELDSSARHRILVVEDEPVSSEILVGCLEDAGYLADARADGAAAWDTLQQAPDRYIAVVLDRMLPGMDGLDLLRRIRNDPVLSQVPVIMQTSLSSHEDIMEGLQAGAHYYLTKPLDPDTFLAIVATAVADYSLYLTLRKELRNTTYTLKHLDQAVFRFHSTWEAQDIATLLAKTCAEPHRIVLGLTELMLNAVEHGNLGIGYDEKSDLIKENLLDTEIQARLQQTPYHGRCVTVRFERRSAELHFLIQDEGKGFDWGRYLELDPDRAFDNHGRGIALAAKMSFDRLEYQGCGNSVLAVAAA